MVFFVRGPCRDFTTLWVRSGLQAFTREFSGSAFHPTDLTVSEKLISSPPGEDSSYFQLDARNQIVPRAFARTRGRILYAYFCGFYLLLRILTHIIAKPFRSPVNSANCLE